MFKATSHNSRVWPRKSAALLGTLYLLATASTATAARPSDSVSAQRLRQGLTHLASFPSRVPGFVGHAAARDWLVGQLRALGLSPRQESFPVAVPLDRGAHLLWEAADGSRQTALYALWPNLVRTSTLPPTSGPLVYAGRGSLTELEGLPLAGSFVVLDFNSGGNWLTCANLGAKAILFLEPTDTLRGQAEELFLGVPLNVPRFYLTREAAGQLPLPQAPAVVLPSVVVAADQRWTDATATNVYVTLRGTDPSLTKESVLLSTHYDSLSVVPAVAPGAENGASAIALLELARLLVASPPRRPVTLLFTDAHHLSGAGMYEFLKRHVPHAKLADDAVVPLDFALSIGLDLTTHNDQLGLFGLMGVQTMFGSAGMANLFLGPYGQKYARYGERLAAEWGEPGVNRMINGVVPEGGKPADAVVGVTPALDAALVLRRGRPGFSLVTTNDVRALVDTPLDTVERVDFDNFTTQVRVLADVLTTALNDDEMLVPSDIQLDDQDARLNGKVVSFDPTKSFVPADPVPGATVLLTWAGQEKTIAGVRAARVALTDEEGAYQLSDVLKRWVVVQAFKSDPQTGALTFAPDLGVNGNQSYPMTVPLDAPEKDHVLVVFECVESYLFDLLDPQYLTRLNKLEILNGNDAVPISFGLQIMEGLPWTSHGEPQAALFVEKDKDWKALLGAGFLGYKMLLLKSSGARNKDEAEGHGFRVAAPLNLTETAYQAACDMFALDQYRVDTLHKFGIEDRRLELLHARTGELLKTAAKARDQRQWGRFLVAARQALGIEARAYPDVKTTSADVVRGIIFYMLLLLPFSFFMERLVFGFADIKRQILGISGFFLAIYVVLRLVHPAFMLTEAPEIILLGFIVLALSLIVISLISQRFEEQMGKVRKGAGKGLYTSDVGRVGAMGVAFTLGIGNMRRRKARTGLTCTTIILLTFTVLSFTSVKTSLRTQRMVRPGKPLYQGVLIRDRIWWPLERAGVQHVIDEFGSQATVAPRAWKTMSDLTQKLFVEVKTDSGKRIDALGVLGLTPGETRVSKLDQQLVAGDWFENSAERACILPVALAKHLGIDRPGATVQLLGQRLTVRGLLDAHAAKDLCDLDEERLTPVDFSSLSQEDQEEIRRTRSAGIEASISGQVFNHVELANCVLVPYDWLVGIGGTIHSVAVRFDSEQQVAQAVADLLQRMLLTLYVGEGDQVLNYSSMRATAMGGLSTLVVPILIAAMIVLNTMLGSVYERLREIGIYSSVGLAPNHVSMLFIGEASVYALLGAIFGYLLGQVVAEVLTTFDILTGLTLNYSSVSAVFSTMLVMGVVWLSTVYPAKKAAQLSVPDVTRRWSMPEPEGDRWVFDFPFTVGRPEALGLFAFLQQFFAWYTEESIGLFYTAGAHLTAEQTEHGRAYLIDSDIWLAPYDMGVKQHVTLRAAPTEDAEVYEIQVVILRREGDVSGWKRLNRRFLDLIRKQFLIWRTVEEDTKQEYRDEGETTLSRAQTKEAAAT